jgi:hypothetical protein
LLLNTIVTACFFQFLLLNGYVKHLLWFFPGSLLRYTHSGTRFIGSDIRSGKPKL